MDGRSFDAKVVSGACCASALAISQMASMLLLPSVRKNFLLLFFIMSFINDVGFAALLE